MREKVEVNFSVRTDGTLFHSSKSDITLSFTEKCPHCGKTMIPIVLNASTTDSTLDLNQNIGVLLRCASEGCKKFFAMQFLKSGNSNWQEVPLTYDPVLNIDIPQNIRELSPEFASIYTQSIIAESKQLDKITGMGFRKAAEFLYKDFAIKRNPDDAEQIKKMPLKQVINKYMKDYPKIQSLSTSVIYLGNDETHYERRNSDKDLQDLKRFLTSSIKFIDADLDVDISETFNNQS